MAQGTMARKEGAMDLTTGNPTKLLLLFSLPLMVGNIFQQLYTVVDTAVVGKVLGVDTLAALGTVDWLNWMTLGIVQGFTQGFGILMAQNFGGKQYGQLRQTVRHAVLLSVLCAVILTGVSEGMVEYALRLLRTPEEILPISVAYLRILFAGIPVVTAYNLTACMLRALGDGKTPLYAMALASAVNIGLDVLFVMKFGWGVQGAAIATVIAQLFSVVYCILQIRRIEVLHAASGEWKLQGKLCVRLMVLGAPMAFQNIVISVGGMIVQSVVNSFRVAFIAGFTATNKLYGLLETAATSYGYAMVTYAGQNLGAEKKERISLGMRSGLILSLATSLVIAGLMLVFGKGILSCFISETGENGIRALGVAYRYLAIMSICLPVLYLLHITRSCIQGMGNTVLPMISGVAEFVMRTGCALLLPAAIGANGIYYAEVLAWIGADLVLIPSYFATKRACWRNGSIHGRRAVEQ